jgi:hypothetical protein
MFFRRLVDHLVDKLVDNKGHKPLKTNQRGTDKRLKRQHGPKLNRPHNPKVAGSNPPRNWAANKRPFFLALRRISNPLAL